MIFLNKVFLILLMSTLAFTCAANNDDVENVVSFILFEVCSSATTQSLLSYSDLIRIQFSSQQCY